MRRIGEAYAVDGTWGETGVALAADPMMTLAFVPLDQIIISCTTTEPRIPPLPRPSLSLFVLMG
jgi:hypothetical protein